MQRLKAACAAFFIVLSACASAPESGQTSSQATATDTTQSTVEKTTFVYATKDGQSLQLDRYVSTDPRFEGKRPVLLYSVGGGWEVADRNDRASVEYLQHFASLGYVAVSIDYRLAIKQAKQSGQLNAANMRQTYLRAIRWGVEDLYGATAYLLQHADEWNIDPSRIVIVGSSAGATNSLVAEFNVANQTELARKHLPEGFRYAGAISMAGAFWLEENTPFAWKQRPAPIMLIHGGKDQLVTYEADERNSAYGPVYAQKQFAANGDASWFIDLPQADHTMAFAGLIDYRSEMEAFLTKMVWDKQALSIHMIENGTISKTFGNIAKLYRRYLPPQLQQQLDSAKQ